MQQTHSFALAMDRASLRINARADPILLKELAPSQCALEETNLIPKYVLVMVSVILQIHASAMVDILEPIANYLDALHYHLVILLCAQVMVRALLPIIVLALQIILEQNVKHQSVLDFLPIIAKYVLETACALLHNSVPVDPIFTEHYAKYHRVEIFSATTLLFATVTVLV